MHVWNFADFKTGQSTMRAAAMNYKGVSPVTGVPRRPHIS